MGEPLRVHEDRVHAEWIDYNRHMRDGYYAVMFSTATDNLMDHLGVDEAYRAETAQTLYTLEMQVRFLREINEDEPFYVTAQMLDADAKKIHVFLRMHASGSDELVATFENILLHVNQAAGPASAPFPEAVAGRVQSLLGAHKALPFPDGAGRPISLARKKPAAG